MIFLIFLLKTLIWADYRCGSNGYPQSMFWVKNKENRYTSVNPSIIIKMWGLRGFFVVVVVVVFANMFSCSLVIPSWFRYYE